MGDDGNHLVSTLGVLLSQTFPYNLLDTNL